MNIPHRTFLEQQDIAVPSMRLHTRQNRHGDKPAFPLQPGKIEQARALAETAVRLL